MSISRRLQAHRQAMASAASIAEDMDPELDPNEVEPNEDEEDTSSSKATKKKEPTMTDTTNAVAEAVAAERTRTNTVLACEHFAGREQLAANLLATELSAEQINAALATVPKIEPSALILDGDDAARAELRQGLVEGQPAATTEADEIAAKAQAKATNHGWDEIHAEVRADRGA